MRDKLLKSFHFVFIFFCLFSMCFVIAISAEGSNEVKSYGSIGDGVVASLTPDGTLVITAEGAGEGKINDYKLSASKRPPYYADASRITRIEVGEGVKHIGEYAFANLGEIDCISLPRSIVYIGIGAFQSTQKNTVVYNGSLEEYLGIEIKNKYASPLYSALELFINGEPLTELAVPDSVSSIGKYAFAGYDALISLKLHTGVTEVLNDAFVDCSNISHLTVPYNASYVTNLPIGSVRQVDIISDSENFSVNRIMLQAFADADVRVLSSEISCSLSSLNVDLTVGNVDVSLTKSESGNKTLYTLSLSQNGTPLRILSETEIYFDYIAGLDENDLITEYSGSHSTIFYDSATGRITVKASSLSSLSVEKTDVDIDQSELKIRGAYLNINESIHLIFTANIPDGYTSALMKVSFLGKSYEISPTPKEGGKYEFRFSEIMPYQMNDVADATLTANNADGDSVSVSYAGMSIRKYAEMVHEQYPADLKTADLLSKMLIYGSECQRYRKYNTDALVTDGIDWLTGKGEVECEDKFSLSLTDADNCFSGAGLYLSDTVGMFFTFKADNEGIKVTVSVNDRIEEYSISDFSKDALGRYVLTYKGIMANELDEVVTAKIIGEDGYVLSTLTYSVGSYALSAPDDEELSSLISSLISYGRSAREYKEQ